MAIYDIEYIEKKKNNVEILDEATIYKGKSGKGSYSLFSDPQVGRNFGYDPYVKIYNNADKSKATELVRVSMKSGKPFDHENTSKDAGKGRLKFTKEVAEFITNAMHQSPTGNTKYPEGSTVYDAIYIDIESMLKDEIKSIKKYPIPNFIANIE